MRRNCVKRTGYLARFANGHANDEINSKSGCREQLLWPAAGIVLGALAGTNRFYEPHVSLELGVVALFADLVLVLILSASPITARVGVLLAGLFLAVPCFLCAPPLSRGLLMCLMGFPLAVAVLPMFTPPTAGFQARLGYLFTWRGRRELKRQARSFDPASLLRLLAATVLFAAALASVKIVPAAGSWLLVRWGAGGIMILAFAEMATASHDFLTAAMGLTAPALMRSPHLSASLGEFWANRWNPAASALVFRGFFFAPLARHGVVLGLFAAFVASALGHVLLVNMATGRWGIALSCGAFFLVQPVFILAERSMKVRRWGWAARRAWVFAALAITSPLVVEPALQLVEPSWGAPDKVLLPTLAVLGFGIAVNALSSLPALRFAQNLRSA